MNKTNQLSEGSIKKVTCSNCGSIIKIAQHPRRQIAYVTCSCGHRIEGNELNKTNQNDTKQLNDLKPFKHGQEGTHGCCQEIHDTLGGKATCCECTGHKCKSNYLEIPNSSNSNDTKQCNHSWIQDAPIKVCYHCGFKPEQAASKEKRRSYCVCVSWCHHKHDLSGAQCPCSLHCTPPPAIEGESIEKILIKMDLDTEQFPLMHKLMALSLQAQAEEIFKEIEIMGDLNQEGSLWVDGDDWKGYKDAIKSKYLTKSKYMKHKPSWYFQKNRKGIAFRFYVGRVKELSPSIVFNIGILWWDFGYAY